MQRYSRADVIRMLRISARQLAQWQKAGLIAEVETFSFFDLLKLKKVRDLRAKRVRSAVIRESLLAMQQVAGMENPLVEAGTFFSGTKVVFRHQGHAVEPIAGQFVIDFDPPKEKVFAARLEAIPIRESATELFATAVALEEDPASLKNAIATYHRVLELDSSHAAAHINLGTLYYNQQDYVLAEKYYRLAIGADDRYALAYFDLGNVLDETGRVEEAIKVYRSAIQLSPFYADAHYNLALAYEKIKEPRKALKHWRAYANLDRTSAWAAHARSQVQKILAAEPLRVVYRRK